MTTTKVFAKSQTRRNSAPQKPALTYHFDPHAPELRTPQPRLFVQGFAGKHMVGMVEGFQHESAEVPVDYSVDDVAPFPPGFHKPAEA